MKIQFNIYIQEINRFCFHCCVYFPRYISPSKFAIFLKTHGKLKSRVIFKFHINHKPLNFS